MTVASARAEAIAAMLAPHVDGTSDDALRAITLGESLDAIPASVHARLAIESGALEQVGWLRPPEHDSTLHRLPRTPAEARHWGEVPVYRLSEETSGASGTGDVRHVAQPGRCGAAYQLTGHSPSHECNRRVSHEGECRCRCGDLGETQSDG